LPTNTAPSVISTPRCLHIPACVPAWTASAALKPRTLLIATNFCLQHQLLVLQVTCSHPSLCNKERQSWIFAGRRFVCGCSSPLVVMPKTGSTNRSAVEDRRPRSLPIARLDRFLGGHSARQVMRHSRLTTPDAPRPAILCLRASSSCILRSGGGRSKAATKSHAFEAKHWETARFRYS
jgi:hypothetical protein